MSQKSKETIFPLVLFILLLTGGFVVFGAATNNFDYVRSLGVISKTAGDTNKFARGDGTFQTAGGSVTLTNTGAGAGVVNGSGSTWGVGTNVSLVATDWTANPSNSVLQSAINGKASTNQNVSVFPNDAQYVTKSVTNGLQPGGTYLIPGDTNGFVYASVTNGLQPGGTYLIPADTNSFVTSAITNGTERALSFTNTNAPAGEVSRLLDVVRIGTNDSGNVIDTLAATLTAGRNVDDVTGTIADINSVTSVDFINRMLKGTTGTNSVDWNFKILYADDGTTVAANWLTPGSPFWYGWANSATNSLQLGGVAAASFVTNGSPSSVVVAPGSSGHVIYNNAGALAGADMLVTNIPSGVGLQVNGSRYPGFPIATGGNSPMFVVSSNTLPLTFVRLDNTGGSAGINGYKFRGTSPSALTSNLVNDVLFNLNAGGFDGVGVQQGVASIRGLMAQDMTTTSRGSMWQFHTTATNTTTSAEKMRLTSEGELLIGTTTGNGNKLRVAGKIESTSGGYVFPDASLQTTAMLKTNATGTTDGSGQFIVYFPSTVNSATATLHTNVSRLVTVVGVVTNQITFNIWLPITGLAAASEPYQASIIGFQ